MVFIEKEKRFFTGDTSITSPKIIFDPNLLLESAVIRDR